MFPALLQLWPVVAALYALDCVVRVGRHDRLFVSLFRGRRFRLYSDGVRMLPTWPFARGFRLPVEPVAAVPEGVFVADGDLDGVQRFDPTGYRLIEWSKIGRLTLEHRRIGLPGAPTLVLPSPAHAQALAARLLRLARLPPEARQISLGEEEEWMTVARATEQLRTIDAALRSLRTIAGVAWLVTLLLLPAVLFLRPHVGLAHRLAAIAGALLIVVAVLAVASVRRLGARRSIETKGVLVPLLLSPPNLLRADAAVALDLLQGFDLAVVAAALLEREVLVPLLRRQRHGAEYALGRSSDGAWQQWWQWRRDRVDAIAREAAIELAELTAAPPSSDPAAVLVCPLCAGGYAEGAAECADCGMPLLPVCGE